MSDDLAWYRLEIGGRKDWQLKEPDIAAGSDQRFRIWKGYKCTHIEMSKVNLLKWTHWAMNVAWFLPHEMLSSLRIVMVAFIVIQKLLMSNFIPTRQLTICVCAVFCFCKFRAICETRAVTKYASNQ